MRRRLAIISGGSRGIGLEVGRQLAEHGYAVAIGARNALFGQAAAEELTSLGSVAQYFPLDVGSSGSVANFMGEVLRAMGSPDVLVNNAGVFPEARDGSLESVSVLDMEDTINTNLLGTLRLTKAVLPSMRERRFGRIVNISSGMGQIQTMTLGAPIYRTSKAALNAFTKALAVELAGSGILVNAMSPGWVRTDMGGADAPRTVKEGADTATWLALLPHDGPTGQFFRDRKEIPW